MMASFDSFVLIQTLAPSQETPQLSILYNILFELWIVISTFV